MSGIFITGIVGILSSGVMAALLMIGNAEFPADRFADCSFPAYQTGAAPCPVGSGPRASSPAAQGYSYALAATNRAVSASRD